MSSAAARRVVSLNRNGEMTGTAWLSETGALALPIGNTNTHAVVPMHWGSSSESCASGLRPLPTTRRARRSRDCFASHERATLNSDVSDSARRAARQYVASLLLRGAAQAKSGVGAAGQDERRCSYDASPNVLSFGACGTTIDGWAVLDAAASLEAKAEAPRCQAAAVLCARYATHDGVELAGSSAGLAALARALEGVRPDKIALSMKPADPYDVTLSALEVRQTEGVLRVAVEGEVLVLSGSNAALQLLAANISAFVIDTPPDGIGAHMHIEWFPGNDFVAEASAPLVVCFE